MLPIEKLVEDFYTFSIAGSQGLSFAEIERGTPSARLRKVCLQPHGPQNSGYCRPTAPTLRKRLFGGLPRQQVVPER